MAKAETHCCPNLYQRLKYTYMLHSFHFHFCLSIYFGFKLTGLKFSLSVSRIKVKSGYGAYAYSTIPLIACVFMLVH